MHNSYCGKRLLVMTLEPPSMKVDRDRGIVEFAITGTVTPAVIEKTLPQFREYSLPFVFCGFVWDLRNADISELNLEALREALQKQPLSVPSRQDMRSAAVLDQRYDGGVGKLWVISGEVYDRVERKVFTDIEAAREWVSLSKRALPAFPMRVDRERSLVEFHLAGMVTADEIIKVGALFEESPLDFRTKGFVWDLRHADLSGYDHEGMMRVLEANSDHIRKGGLRIATVAAKIVDRQLLYLWERIAESYDDNERRIFVSLDEARRWVAQNPVGGGPASP